MKKIIGLLLGLMGVFTLASCDLSALTGGSNGDSQTEAVESVDSGEHKHVLIKVAESTATCAKEGNVTYWKCKCGELFLDAEGTETVEQSAVVIAKEAHDLKYTAGIEPTCKSGGRMEYWSCSKCFKHYKDEDCTQEVKLSEVILTAAHELVYHEAKPVIGTEDGVVEHWSCSVCEGYFSDAEGKNKMKEADTVIVSVLGIPDFIVEVPAGRDPVVLQLTDTQIIDAAQVRPGGNTYETIWATDQIEERLFDYLTETITVADPDFIIITGDLVHGAHDDNGTSLLKLIDFMDSFEIPWSPVFGNHEAESKKGIDWQCEQLENSQYCLFEQKELTGNGNYSVGIVQEDEIKRVFYMTDTNACTEASEESMKNGHTVNNYCGMMQDQIDWYTAQIKLLKKYVPNVKISFAYHIQPAVFKEAYFKKYGFDLSSGTPNINIDTYEGKEDGDFGYIGANLIGPWDHDRKVFNGMKALGVDSIFVGHVHYNCASVVYEGVRLHYGVKSGEYDRMSVLDTKTGLVTARDNVPAGSTPIIGGSIIILSETDGTIKNIYNYYSTDKNGIIKNGVIQWHLVPSSGAKSIAPRKEYTAILKKED